MKEGGMVGQRGSEAEDEQSEIQNHKSGKLRNELTGKLLIKITHT